MFNDNHVLLKAGLLEDSEQGNIKNLYETEVKPLGTTHDEEEKEQEMLPPSPTGNIKIKIYNNKGGIVNISSPFKECEDKDPNLSSPFCKSFLSPLCNKYIYQDSPLLKDTLTPFKDQNPLVFTPGSTLGMGEGREEGVFQSPFLNRHTNFGINGAD